MSAATSKYLGHQNNRDTFKLTSAVKYSKIAAEYTAAVAPTLP